MAIVENQMVEVKWNNANRKYYVSLGYEFTKNKDVFHVPVRDLPKSSRAQIQLECDYCSKQYQNKYSSVTNSKNNFCTRDCQNKFLVGKPSLNANKITVNCDYCDKVMERSAFEKDKSKHLFCSKDCSNKFKVGKKLDTKTVKLKISCFQCQKEIVKTEKQINKQNTHFCSHACASLYSKRKDNLKNRNGKTVPCYNCGDLFHLPKYRIESQEHYFCKNDCRLQWMKTEDYTNKFGKRENPDTLVTKNCCICNTEVTRKWWDFKGDNCLCDNENCKVQHAKLNNPKKDVDVNCSQCNKEFKTKKSKREKNKWMFCSRDCYSSFRSENFNGENNYKYQDMHADCDNCGESVKVTKYYLENKKNTFCGQQCYYEFRTKYYVGDKHPQFGTKKTPEQIEVMRLATASRIANGEFPQTNTSIQIKVRTILNNLGINFEEEKQFKYYVLDFYLPETNLAIEVMGDYWHANPMKYPNYDSLHQIQKKDIIRDKAKRTYLKKYHNVNVLYLWERDINTKTDTCSMLIVKFIESLGQLKDYNSFNYSGTNSCLELNDTIITPYFSRANTILQKKGTINTYLFYQKLYIIKSQAYKLKEVI